MKRLAGFIGKFFDRWFVQITIVVILFAFFLYLKLLFDVSIQSKVKGIGEAFGTFGDSFGAFTALFSGLAFAGILITIKLQRYELKETRDQIEHQHIENSFFLMLKLQQDIVQSIDLQRVVRNKKTNIERAVETKGRDCIKVIYNRLLKKYKKINTEGVFDGEMDLICQSYNSAWKRNQSDLGHYFRALYNLFRFLSENIRVNPHNYARVIRSLLSDHEILLIFYNCITDKGSKFKKYAIQYKLFDNLDVNLLISPSHVLLLESKEAFGQNTSALKIYDRERKIADTEESSEYT